VYGLRSNLIIIISISADDSGCGRLYAGSYCADYEDEEEPETSAAAG